MKISIDTSNIKQRKIDEKTKGVIDVKRYPDSSSSVLTRLKQLCQLSLELLYLGFSLVLQKLYA